MGNDLGTGDVGAHSNMCAHRRKDTNRAIRTVAARWHVCAAVFVLAMAPIASRGDDDTVAGKREAVPVYDYDVVAAWPHDGTAYTQGLVVDNGVLYESTGRYGESSLRVVELQTGKIQKRVDLPRTYFGEGIAVLGTRIYQLTWRSRKGFIYDRDTLARVGEFAYDGEGWGLTSDGRQLIMSDGTDTLRYLDPTTFRVRKTVKVRDRAGALRSLNELEFVNGEIFANIWHRDTIVRIDPETGNVRGWIDLSGLRRTRVADAVLNGIAYDAHRDRLLVTGKLWPEIFQIRLRRRELR